MKFWKAWLSIAIVMIVLVIALWGILQEYQKGIVEIPIKAEIEKQREVIKVENIKYEVIEIKREGLGGAGGGGLGAVPIIPESAQQFLNLTAPDELVLMCFQLSDDHYTLTKVYKGSINRTGDLLIYEDTYECEYKETISKIIWSLKVHSYTGETVIFQWSNIGILLLISVIFIIFGAVLLYTIWIRI